MKSAVSFGQSPLVRLLGEWAGAPAASAAGQPDVVEQLGDWLDVRGAITLHAELPALQAAAAAPAPPARPQGLGAAEATARQLQRALTAAIADACPEPEDLAVALRLPGAGRTSPAEAADAAFRQRHAELQRQMDTRIAALRAQLRQTVARASPRLRALAALDARLEPLLAERTQRLLAGALPALLARRHAQHLAAAAAADAAGGVPDRAADDPAAPGDARAARAAAAAFGPFAADWQAALRAELELRMAPVQGLLAAWRHEIGT